MRRYLVIVAVFLLGIGTSQLLSSFFISPKPQDLKRQATITKEATSTGALELKEASESAYVIRVIDGDTIELIGGRRVRYIGINTPETVDPRKPVECFGKEASNENKILVDRKSVRLEKDASETDRYGRLLRYVYVDNIMVNDYLVRQGFGHSYSYPPDVKYQNQFLQAQQEAEKNNRGLWAGCVNGNTSNASNPSKAGNTENTNTANMSGVNGCTIKGNVSASGEKIYHLPSCDSYDKTSIDEGRGERWFCKEEEAGNAGWRKAKNCP